MFSLIPSDANDPQGLMRRKEPNKQTNSNVCCVLGFSLAPKAHVYTELQFQNVSVSGPMFITPGRRQSKTLLTIDERGSKIAGNSVFDYHLSPV